MRGGMCGHDTASAAPARAPWETAPPRLQAGTGGKLAVLEMRDEERGKSCFTQESREGQKHSLPEMREKGTSGALLPWAERGEMQASVSPP